MTIAEILETGHAAIIAEYRGMSPRVINVTDKVTGQKVERHLMELSFECGNNGAVNAAQITLWDITAPEKFQADFIKVIPRGTMCLIDATAVQQQNGIAKISTPRDQGGIYKLEASDSKLLGIS